MSPIVLPEGVWSAWSLHPPAVGLIVLAALAYLMGVRRRDLWPPETTFGRRHMVSFYAGLGALAVALVSPLDRLGATLFSGHMVQHLVLISVAAPLLVYGRPGLALFFALPENLRRQRVGWAGRAGAALLSPVVVVALHTVVLWVWHLPSVYQAALLNDALHIIEHMSFLATAILLWALIVGGPTKRRLGYAPAVLVVLVTSLQSGALGALLTFATSELYPIHRGGAAAWGLNLLEDQHLAGAIMWIPQGMVYMAAMAILLWKTFAEVEARVLREEAAEAEGAALQLGGRV